MLNNIAIIRADECIGCNKCVPACPVDCIVGAPQYLHMVIEHECIGCNKCLSVCPVDCIDIIKKDVVLDKQKTKSRVLAKKQRLEQRKQQQKIADFNIINNIESKLKKLLNNNKS